MAFTARSARVGVAAVLAMTAAFGCSAGQDEPVGRACRTCRGAADLNGTARLTECQLLSSYLVTPVTAPVGADIGLLATIAPEAGAVAIAWTTDRGTIATPQAANTTLRCTGAGVAQVTVTATTETCHEVDTLHVVCVDCAVAAADPACPNPGDGG